MTKRNKRIIELIEEKDNSLTRIEWTKKGIAILQDVLCIEQDAYKETVAEIEKLQKRSK